MRKKFKPRQPASLQDAIRLCLDFALHRHNRSVARIGELCGVTEWVIYKWMTDNSIPSKRIRTFEFACGCTFITQYIGLSAGKLLIDIPSGRDVDQANLLDLQNTVNDAVKLLTDFYRGQTDASDVLLGVTAAMEQLAGHRENVRKHSEPELALFGEDGE